MQNLYSPFAQADSTVSKNYGGTGLGLWISKAIINKMGGDIQEGRGSNFIVAFPMKIVQSQSPFKQLRSSCKILLNCKRCLIVDDIYDNREIIKEIFLNHKISVWEASNGKEGYNIYSQNEPNFFDAIITDLRMPIMSGQDMIKKNRNHEENHKIQKTPILVITGDPSENEQIKCLEKLDADGFLNKPIIIEEFYNTMIEILNKSNSKNNRQKVMYVDDDVMSTQVLSHLFMKENIEFLSSNSITKAFELYKTEHNYITLIVMDNFLGDGTGVQCSRSIIKFEEENLLPKCPIVSLSGNSIRQQQDAYQGIEIYSFIEKPITSRKIKNLLSMLV